MGQQKAGLVYDPSSGRGVTIDEAQALIAAAAPRGGNDGGFMSTFNQSPSAPVTPEGPQEGNLHIPMFTQGPFGDPTKEMSLTVPPNAGETTEQIMAAVPQIAGMLATMHPALRGFKASMLIPAVIRGLEDYAKTGEIDPNKMAEDAVLGLTGHAVGAAGSALTKGGTSIVRRSLGLSGDYLNEAAEQTLPRAAIRENAHMTPEGVQALHEKFNQTGAGVYDDLANVLKQAGLKSRNAPNFNGGGLTTLIGSKLLPPETQLEVGKFMAKPFGLASSETLGRGAEQGIRALFAYLQSQLPGNAMMAPQGGPQRRPLAP